MTSVNKVNICCKQTKVFSVFDSLQETKYVTVNLGCVYTSGILKAAIQRRPKWATIDYNSNVDLVQFSDFEEMEWDKVMSGAQRASSYVVRKGLSRKAQFALQLKKFACKQPKSMLAKAAPFTINVETWGAFDDAVNFNFGVGVRADFDFPGLMQTDFRTRLEWALESVKEDFDNAKAKFNINTWILKPSVANKGMDIFIIRSWNNLLDALESVPDMREWVLQRYIENPVLVKQHKFHLRVYVLAVGALQVFVFNRILMLLAARPYSTDENLPDDMFGHLTNTAHSCDLVDFDEELFVQLLEDLPGHMAEDYGEDFISNKLLGGNTTDQRSSMVLEQHVRQQINGITADIFSAYENEYTIFCPMDQCFELYGLDFMMDLDNNFQVSILEVNPGPDFKQTGSRLKTVIEDLIEETCEIVLDQDESKSKKNTKNFTKVYEKEWSVSNMSTGMKMND